MKDPGLRILPTHRAVKSSDTNTSLRGALGAFEVVRVPGDNASAFAEQLAATPSAIGMVRKGEGFSRLVLRDADAIRRAAPEHSDAWRALPVAILDELITAAVVGKDLPQAVAEGRLVYVKGAADAVTMVESGRMDAAFLLNSTPLSALEAVASNGERMPAKSTYFFPKLLSGLVMRLIR
jgi:uncharacterized protein (DUF1015 family)